MQQETKDKTISASITMLLLAATIVLCSWLGYHLPNPPIEEEGMGVAGEVLGEVEGFGNNDQATFDDNSSSASASNTPEESYTTGNETTPVAKTTKNETEPTPTKKTEPATNTNNNKNTTAESPKPTTNPNATFQGRKNGNGGEGKGTASGSGQAGSPNGTQGAQGGTGSGIGAGYSLGSRGLRGTLPKPSYDTQKDGDVVVEIWVDREGNVVDVKAPAKGSKNYDNAMVEAAKQAARKAHFSKDPNATEKQKGTITYKFRRVG